VSLRLFTYLLKSAWLVTICVSIPCFSQSSPSNESGNRVVESAISPENSTASYSADKTTNTAKTAPALSTDSGVQVDDSYRVGIEDELQISVWREPEISSQVVVRPDGFISLPLLNDLQVEGLTTKELQALITTKLKSFLTEPQVTVIVRQIRSRKVYLLGQVNKPGSYVLNGDKTVLQLLAEAGGVGQFAKTKAIYVVRRSGGREVRLPFNYKRALNGKDSKSDIELSPGDMIVVP
jgi:polysaccharide export outer membrane protein